MITYMDGGPPTQSYSIWIAKLWFLLWQHIWLYNTWHTPLKLAKDLHVYLQFYKTSDTSKKSEMKFCKQWKYRKKNCWIFACMCTLTLSQRYLQTKVGNAMVKEKSKLLLRHKSLTHEIRNLVIVSDPHPLRLLVTPPVSFTNIAMSNGSFSVRSDSQMLPPINSWTTFKSAERHWNSSFSSSWSIRSCLDSQLTFQERMALYRHVFLCSSVCRSIRISRLYAMPRMSCSSVSVQISI